MSLYAKIVAAGYDRFMAGAERAGLAARRSELLCRARGRGLEIGAGTGSNLRYYGAGVEELVLTEPDEAMARKLERSVGASVVPARVVRATAEELPFGDAEFDFVVSTLVLCTVEDPVRSLDEISRVLKSGGQFLFLEHVRSGDPRLARWQDRLDGLWVRFGRGCHSNRRTLEVIVCAGFRAPDVQRDVLRLPLPIVHPLVVGVAVPGSNVLTGVSPR